MADVRPFCAVRPAKGREAEIAALPYDVYSREEARHAVEGKPLSFLRIDRAETSFPEGTSPYDPRVYQKAGELLQGMLDRGEMIQDKEAAYYIYELTMDGRSQTGIAACASVDDYLSGRIKKHENTRKEKEEDRIRHVEACHAQTGPIFLACRSDSRLKALTEGIKKRQPDFDFTAEDSVRHRGWRTEGKNEVEEIREAFLKMDALYIADGHHRAASAVRAALKKRQEHPEYTGEEAFNFVLSVIFPDDELRILDYNRVVRDLNGLSEEEFLAKTAEAFEIRKLPGAEHPKKKGEITLLLGKQWYLLTKKDCPDSEDPVESLDVSVLQREILDPVLGIEDPKTDKRIDFVGGIRGLSELEKRTENGMAAAFTMYPTSIQELFDVADAGKLMPPKSTWFEPKLRSGLYLHLLADPEGNES